MSGINANRREIRKGAPDAIEKFVGERGGKTSGKAEEATTLVEREGGTALVVADGARVMGVVRLKDVVKTGIRERLFQLHRMGITSAMITGDNPVTAAAIAAEAGIDDFFSQVKPAIKLDLIRKYQEAGHLVAMIGDGTNDAPALAQADVAVAMNAGTQVAREAANMIDLDSNPTKLLDIVEIGKQILITRGALTTFSVANDVAKYFAIIPAVFAATYPMLGILNIMRLATPQSAVLSAVIFNAIIIPALIPLALRGVRYRPSTAVGLLLRNLLIYGVGGLILPFVGIKLIDLFLVWTRLV
jgi:K+-transporting ATPase ATPase B chain